MADEHWQPAPDRPDPSRTTHELVNVLAAVQIHVFMARRGYLQHAAPDDEARPVSEPEQAVPATPVELLTRLEGMVDRALQLANELDQQLRPEELR